MTATVLLFPCSFPFSLYENVRHMGEQRGYRDSESLALAFDPPIRQYGASRQAEFMVLNCG